VVPLPDRVSFLQGLVYFVNMRIAYLAYYVFGKVNPGDTILLHAAAGGIGVLLTQIAKRHGDNTVIALSRSDEKLDYCRKNGADHLINYQSADYVEEVPRITGGQGVDISLNSVDGATLETDPGAIKPTGRWVIYGYAGRQGHDRPPQASAEVRFF
jgi:NADPH:quinone reductase